MTKFYYKSDFGEDDFSVDLEWEAEEEHIYEILDRFKTFLLAKTYSHQLVRRVVYLTDDQLAKLNLLDEELEDDL